MAKYRIKVIQHLLKNNKIGKAGEEYGKGAFINLQASLDGGFVEKVKDSKSKDKNKDKNKGDEGAGENSEAQAIKVVKKLSKDDLKQYAIDNKFAFDESANKGKLLQAVIRQIENGPDAQDEEE